MRLALVVPACLGLATATVALQRQLDSQLGSFRAQEGALYLWKGEQVKRLVPGFENLAADLYWLRTVQYFGGQRLFATEKKFELLGPLTEITTTLDPRFEMAYRLGATFLSEPHPVGAGRPHEGVALLERGAKALPHSWRLRQDLGFFTHLFLGDNHRAAAILIEGRKIPGAPEWLETLAAQIYTNAGDRAAARRMWQQLFDQAEGAWMKGNALQHLQQLDAKDGALRVQEAVRAYERRTGRRPSDLRQVVGPGLPKNSLLDPSGVPYEYDPASGTVAVSMQSTLWRPL